MTSHEPTGENTKLLALLATLFGCLVVALVIVRHRLLVRWTVVVVVALAWFTSWLVLRLRRDTWGRERRVVDWWSLPHGLGGVLLGLLGLGGGTVVIVGLAWESVEVASRVKEFTVNRIADVVLGFVGWIVANLVSGGTFPPW
jgi:hypothetical protein